MSEHATPLNRLNGAVIKIISFERLSTLEFSPLPISTIVSTLISNSFAKNGIRT